MNNTKNQPRVCFFSINEEAPIAELVLSHPEIVHLLMSFNIPFGFEDKTIGDVCAEQGISVDTFLLLAQVYCNYPLNSGLPTSKKSIADLLLFLQNNHRFYQSEILPHLSARLDDGLSVFEDARKEVFLGFFRTYREEVFQHFAYEEQTVFPYVKDLLEGKDTSGYTIVEFSKNHSDIEQKLSDLKNLLLKHLDLPKAEGNSEKAIRLLSAFFLELSTFEQLLRHHTFVENHILLPTILGLEKLNSTTKAKAKK